MSKKLTKKEVEEIKAIKAKQELITKGLCTAKN